MRRIIASLGIAFTLSFGATLEEATIAYNKGDYQTTKTIFEDLASKGDATAQHNLGVMYDFGKGVKQDYFKAKEWYVHTPEQFGQPADLHPDTLPELILICQHFIYNTGMTPS